MSAFGRKNGPARDERRSSPELRRRQADEGRRRRRRATTCPRPAATSSLRIPGEIGAMESAPEAAPNRGDAMTRLADRANAVNDHSSEVGGFEASVHKIKEQVLPRLLERVDPEAAATLTKEELSARNSARSSWRC